MSSVGICPINRKDSSDRKGNAGFTLIELIVVMTIAGIIAGLIAVSWRHFYQARSFQLLTQEILTTLRLAAVEAENTGTEQRVYFDPVANAFAVWKLPAAGAESDQDKAMEPVFVREIALPADITVNLQYDPEPMDTATAATEAETTDVGGSGGGWPDSDDYIRFGGGLPATAVHLELKNAQDVTRLIVVTANGRASEVQADEMETVSTTESYE